MAKIQDPRPGTSNIAVVDPTFNALRMTLRPGEFQGAYRLATRTGTIAATPFAAGSWFFSFRYIGTGTATIHSVRVGMNNLVGFTQGACTFTLNVFRGAVASDTAGTQITGGNIQKVRSAMTQMQIDARISTTVTLAVPTAPSGGVEDPASFGSVQFNCPTTLSAQPMQELLPMSWFSKPLTLTMNEGFRIKNVAALPATGTWIAPVSVYWTEYPAVSTFFY